MCGGVKQNGLETGDGSRPDIRIKYASKYDESSNYWKNSIGTKQGHQASEGIGKENGRLKQHFATGFSLIRKKERN